MSRYKDFDKFYKEQKREPVKFKLFGEVHELHPAIPASLMLKIMKMQREKGSDTEISAEVAAEMIIDLLGRKKFDKLCEKGLDFEQMNDLIWWIIGEYNGTNEDNSEKKKE